MANSKSSTWKQYKLPVNNFEWIEGRSQFNVDFIKIYNDESDEEFFLKIDVRLHKTEYLIHIENLKQALYHGFVSRNVHRVIKFYQNSRLKPCIDMNTYFRKKSKKMTLKKIFFKLMNNAIFGETMENVRKYRDNKLVTTERRRNYLVSEPNYHTTFFLQKIY